MNRETSRIDHKPNFEQQLEDEQERLITAIEHEIVEIAGIDTNVSPEIQSFRETHSEIVSSRPWGSPISLVLLLEGGP